jgi:hypothetical protein
MECGQKVLQHHQHIHQALFHLVHHRCFPGVLPETVQGFQLLHPLPPLWMVPLLQNQHQLSGRHSEESLTSTRSPTRSSAATPVRAAAADRPWVLRNESVYVIYVVTGGAFKFGLWPCCYHAPQSVNKGGRKRTAIPLVHVNSGAMVKNIWRSSISAWPWGLGRRGHCQSCGSHEGQDHRGQLHSGQASGGAKSNTRAVIGTGRRLCVAIF